MKGERVGFTGHQRLTAKTRNLVSESISRSIQDYVEPTGICSLAEGSDQLFAQIMLASGGALVVVVPCYGYDQTFTEPAALAAYHSLILQAKEIIQLEHPEPSEEAFWDAGKRVVQESDRVIAVWDGHPAGGLGGTADVVEFARDQNKSVEVIWPKDAARS